MAGAFDFKIDSNGARIVVARLPLTPDCIDGDAIDATIEALKHDLDAVAVKMKESGDPPAGGDATSSHDYSLTTGADLGLRLGNLRRFQQTTVLRCANFGCRLTPLRRPVFALPRPEADSYGDFFP
jgi:hypothetical protein